jgi:hypothetical protein
LSGASKRRFLKKARKNFFDAGSGALARPTPIAQRSRSLFASFSSEKEALAFPLPRSRLGCENRGYPGFARTPKADARWNAP